MGPANFRRIEDIALNLSMMEGATEALPDRVDAHMAIMQEIAAVYLATAQEGVPLPESFNRALDFTAGFIYRLGSPAFGDDITHALVIDIGHERLDAEQERWLPQNEADFALVAELTGIGSQLAIQDNERAYQPHFEGRYFEALDPYDVWYNKYGVIISGSQTFGSHI